MNYAKHYDRLITRAQFRVIDGYCEKHHIVPRCMGGGDESSNIAKLTAKEHYVAHQLLVKLHPDVGPLATAMILMGKNTKNGKAYEWLRKRSAAAVSRMTERNAKIGLWAKGNTFAKALKGRKRPPMSDEWHEKLAAHLRKFAGHRKGSVVSFEGRARMSEAFKARQGWNQKGEQNHASKLTAEQVRYMRHLYFAEQSSQSSLAKFFGVSVPTISMIVNGHRWAK